MHEALDAGGNPSAVHASGRRAKRHLEDAREMVADVAGTCPDRVVFTSGGTEANALALHGRRVLASAVEHPAVLRHPHTLGERLPVDAAGCVRVEAVARMVVATGADTVAVMAANNETGVIQPLAAVRDALPEGVNLHVDAVQVPGRLDLAPLVAQADSLALSSHKVGGPAGAGALILAPGFEPVLLIAGGGQERGLRGGTENVPAAAGFAAALTAIDANEIARVRELRSRLEAGLRALVANLVVLGDGAPRLINTLAVTAPGWRAERLLMALDLAGVAVSSGAACSSGTVKRSHVLEAMGVCDDLIDGMLRFSLGWSTIEADIDEALARIAPILGRRRAA